MTDTIFTDYQSLLYPIARNLLGNSSDAEDLVQETMLKWLSMDRSDIENVRGYLVRTLINKCLNFIRDRKRESRQEIEVAPELLRAHLPSWIENGRSLSLGFLAMLEKLSAMERAVFLLKEVFGYSHREISALLDISEENSRQILVRARRHLQQDQARFEVDPEQHQELYQSFVRVVQGEDMGQLLEILQDDIQIEIARPAATWVGQTAALRFFRQHRWDSKNLEIRPLRGAWALVVYEAGQARWVVRLFGHQHRIQRIRVLPIVGEPVYA